MRGAPDLAWGPIMLTWIARALLASTAIAVLVLPALAADLIEPQPVMPQPPIVEAQPFGGWYLRGDVGYRWSQMKSADYTTYGPPAGTGRFDFTDLSGSWSGGVGVGYQVNRHFRTDLTGDYWAKSKFTGGTSGVCDGDVPCSSHDSSSYSALLLLANAYIDLGTYGGFTPYIGAGIGGAHLKWDTLHNTIGDTTTDHRGTNDWRFAYALMVGASYCLTDRLMLDAGYRYAHVQGGQMFDFAPIAGPGFDSGLNINEIRGGLRFQFGGRSNCEREPVVAYAPEPQPVEPPVFK